MATKGKKKGGVPELRRHKPSKRTVVRLNGKDHYVGAWPDEAAKAPAEARAAYDALIARWLVNRRQSLPTPEEEKRRLLGEQVTPAGVLTVADLSVRFADHAKGYYVTPDG